MLSPHIYDLIEIIQEKMVNSLDPSVRKSSSAIFERFLLTYPLEEKRQEQHMLHVLKNMEYEDEDARLTLLKLVEKLIKKLARVEGGLVDRFGELIFIQLLIRVNDDTHKECKAIANNSIRILLQNCDPALRSKMVKGVMTNKSTDPVLLRVKMLLAGLLLTVGQAESYFPDTVF